MRKSDSRAKLLTERKRRAADRPQAEPLPVWDETVQGGSLVRQLQRHVAKLRGEEHGNRQLFLDDVFLAYLLAFFNPSIRSLRTIEDFSQTRQAQAHLAIPRICRSTLSDFQRLADPGRLAPIVQALKAKLAKAGAPGRLPDVLAGLHKQVLAVDGPFLPAAAEVAWAVRSRNQRAGECHRARLDWQVDIATWLPEVVVV